MAVKKFARKHIAIFTRMLQRWEEVNASSPKLPSTIYEYALGTYYFLHIWAEALDNEVKGWHPFRIAAETITRPSSWSKIRGLSGNDAFWYLS